MDHQLEIPMLQAMRSLALQGKIVSELTVPQEISRLKTQEKLRQAHNPARPVLSTLAELFYSKVQPHFSAVPNATRINMAAVALRDKGDILVHYFDHARDYTVYQMTDQGALRLNNLRRSASEPTP